MTSRHTGHPSRKMLYILAFVLLLGAIFGIRHSTSSQAAPKTAAPERPVKLFRLTDDAGGRTYSLPGTVQSQRRVNLAFRIPGQIVSFPVLEGQKVEKGRRIALLDRTDYAHAAASLEARLQGAEAALVEARLHHDRTNRLFDKAMVPQSALDAALATLGQAEGAVGQLTADLSRARSNLAYADLRAPFTGTVTATLAENFQNVQAQQPVAGFQDIERLEVVVSVPESDIAAVSEGQTATARFEALPRETFALAVSEIAAEADAATRTYAVTLALPKSSGHGPLPVLFPGMTAEVAFKATASTDTGFSVPISALFAAEGGGVFVWRLTPSDMTVHQVPILAGDLNQDAIHITGPLRAGDDIVSAGVHFLQEGQRVRPLIEEKVR